jgi:hypothetical protein
MRGKSNVIKKNFEKVWDARYTLGARYLSKNTVFIQQISVLNILNVLHNLLSFLFKMPLFHNSTSFGSCIIHILNTGCANIFKKAPAPKG